jgi:hypothetical protein
MHRVRVVRSNYEQSAPYVGRVGEVIGHWGADSNEGGRDGYMVQFDDGAVVGLADDEVVTVTDSPENGEGAAPPITEEARGSDPAG